MILDHKTIQEQNKMALSLINSLGDLSALPVDKIEVTSPYYESSWKYEDKSILPASAALITTIKGVEIKVECNVNLIIHNDGRNEVHIFDHAPTVNESSIWITLTNAHGADEINDIETTLAVYKLLPTMHPSNNLDSIKQRGIEVIEDEQEEIKKYLEGLDSE